MKRRVRALAAVAALALVGCARPHLDPLPTPTPSASATPVKLVDAKFLSLDPALLISATIEHLHAPDSRVDAVVPTLVRSPDLSAGLHIVRNALLRNFAWSNGSSLQIDWQLLGSSASAVGVLLTSDVATPAGRQLTPSVIWYDPVAHAVHASPALIAKGRWSEFVGLVTAAAGELDGLDSPALALALASEAQPRGAGPALGFNRAGDMLVAFAGGVVVPGSELTVVVLPAERVAALLSPFGRKASQAATNPTAFDPVSAPKPTPKAPPPAPKTQPASPGLPSGYATASVAAAAQVDKAPILPLATTSSSVSPTPIPSDPTATPSESSSPSPTPSAMPSKPPTPPKITATPQPSVSASFDPSDDRPNVYVVPDCTRLHCVALTFDDGPAAGLTDGVLRALLAAKAPATFFVLGSSVEANPGLVLREAALGMEVGSHTWRHIPMRQQSEATNEFNLTKNLAAVAALTGERPTLMRPPYGDHSRAVNALIADVNQSIVMWTVDTRDWESKDTASTIAHAFNDTRPGDIILMHDVQDSTLPAVPAVISGLRKLGFTIVSVLELSQPGAWAPGAYFCSAPFLNAPCW